MTKKKTLLYLRSVCGVTNPTSNARDRTVDLTDVRIFNVYLFAKINAGRSPRYTTPANYCKGVARRRGRAPPPGFRNKFVQHQEWLKNRVKTVPHGFEVSKNEVVSFSLLFRHVPEWCTKQRRKRVRKQYETFKTILDGAGDRTQTENIEIIMKQKLKKNS